MYNIFQFNWLLRNCSLVIGQSSIDGLNSNDRYDEAAQLRKNEEITQTKRYIAIFKVNGCFLTTHFQIRFELN